MGGGLKLKSKSKVVTVRKELTYFGVPVQEVQWDKLPQW
jgi:hypothetical protein